MSNVAFEAALIFARKGIPILALNYPVPVGEVLRCSCAKPNCSSPAKHPLTPHGVHDATANPDTLSDWWKRYPEANEGIATGRCSGLIAVDVDPRNGGDDTLRHLEREHGDPKRRPQVLAVHRHTLDAGR